MHKKQGQMISDSTEVKNLQELSRKLTFQMHPESLKKPATNQGDLHRFGRQIWTMLIMVSFIQLLPFCLVDYGGFKLSLKKTVTAYRKVSCISVLTRKNQKHVWSVHTPNQQNRQTIHGMMILAGEEWASSLSTSFMLCALLLVLWVHDASAQAQPVCDPFGLVPGVQQHCYWPYMLKIGHVDESCGLCWSIMLI